MEVEFRQCGIYLPQIDLWLDCTEDCGVNWISHGHSDHARGVHNRVFATPETARIYHMRVPDAAATFNTEPLPQEYNGARLTAYPASHIVGAAQLLIEYRGERLVYTGDIKLSAPICGSLTEIVPCDRLIVESTFGLPIYRFLDRDEARSRIVAAALESLADHLTPVFIGYSLGRGQEIAHVLCEAGIPTAVHGSIARFIPVYESAGYAFPGWIPYAQGATAGKALVVTPDFRNFLEASGKAIRIVYVSGWAALDNARARTGAEELIPYSDHAGFDELLQIVERSGARQIDVVHGYTEPFARILRGRGFEARAPLAVTARGAVESIEG
jgi:Cft2 family RNA processing exonuclease